MRGKDEKLLDIFNSNGKRFIIPSYQRNYDLSINNESDWERMAEYHSVWSKKIYDVLVPYVRDYVRAKTIDA